MKRLIFCLIILLIGPFCKGQLLVDERLSLYFEEDQLDKFEKVELRNNAEVYYDSTFNKIVFGQKPREILVSGVPFFSNHIQINYEFSSTNCPGNGYGPTSTIIDEVSWVFGKPSSVEWSKNSIDLTWKSKGINISLKHFELEEEELILVRLDLISDANAIAQNK